MSTGIAEVMVEILFKPDIFGSPFATAKIAYIKQERQSVQIYDFNICLLYTSDAADE